MTANESTKSSKLESLQILPPGTSASLPSMPFRPRFRCHEQHRIGLRCTKGEPAKDAPIVGTVRLFRDNGPLRANVTVRTIPSPVNFDLQSFLPLSLSLLLSSTFYCRASLFREVKRKTSIAFVALATFLLFFIVPFCHTYQYCELSAFFQTNSTTSLRLLFLDEIPYKPGLLDSRATINPATRVTSLPHVPATVAF